MQGVPLSQRFAMVPLGPPLLAYSPTAKVLPAARRSATATGMHKQSPLPPLCAPRRLEETHAGVWAVLIHSACRARAVRW